MYFPSNLYNFSTYSNFIHASKLDSNKRKCPYNYHNYKNPFFHNTKYHFKPQYANIFKTKHNKSCSHLETTKNEREIWKKIQASFHLFFPFFLTPYFLLQAFKPTKITHFPSLTTL